MTLFGSNPQLAAITTVGLACSILVHNSLAAKPEMNIYRTQYNHQSLSPFTVGKLSNGLHVALSYTHYSPMITFLSELKRSIFR